MPPVTLYGKFLIVFLPESKSNRYFSGALKYPLITANGEFSRPLMSTTDRVVFYFHQFYISHYNSFAEKRRLITIRLFSVLHNHRLHTCKSFANMMGQMYTEIYKKCQVKMSDSQDSSPIPPKSLFYKKCAKIEKKVLKYLSSYSII